MSDIGFSLNYTNLHEILVPGIGWQRIGAGIQTITPNGNETTDQTGYYDGEGLASTLVTGGQVTLAFSGHRKYGDPAQDYIASLALSYGAAREVEYRWTAPDGQVIQGDAALANIVPGGGDANSKSTFSFEAHINGRPTLTAGDKDSFPTGITASAATVKVGATFKVTPTVAPATADPACAFAIEDDTIARVGSDGTITGVKAGTTNLSIKSMVLPSIGIAIVVTVTAT
jgi:hypothetical protein